MKTLNLKLYLVTLGGEAGKKSDGEGKAVIAYSLTEAIALIEADPEHGDAKITRIEEHRGIDYLTDLPIDYEKYSPS